MRTKFKNKIPLCACGCGNPITWSIWNRGWNRFLPNHNRKGTISPLKGRKRPIEIGLKISKSLTGKQLSEEHKEKISRALKGKKLSEEHKLKIGKGNKGKKTSDETKLKMSKTHVGEKNPMFGKKFSVEHLLKISGKNSCRWKGGISCEPYCIDWTKEYKNYIKERDNHTCQNPDCRNNYNHLPLHIHHINYIKKDCIPKNLLTLCCSCNARANTNREYWTLFYQEIVEQKYTLKEAA